MDGARPGFHLPLLLIAAFRELIDGLHEELARQGHPGVRPVHGFALQALGPEGTTATELGRRLGVSKQAAGKTLDTLEEMGYVTRSVDPHDGRARRATITARGRDALARSAGLFQTLRSALADRIGEARVAELENDLAVLAGPSPLAGLGDVPGWLGPAAE